MSSSFLELGVPAELSDVLSSSGITTPTPIQPAPLPDSLPAVRRILEQTPRGGQRMLFSATLDAGVNVLVKRFLDNPATHEADSAQSPVSTMDHHVLHVHRDHRVSVLVDLASAPGRTV